MLILDFTRLPHPDLPSSPDRLRVTRGWDGDRLVCVAIGSVSDIPAAWVDATGRTAADLYVSLFTDLSAAIPAVPIFSDMHSLLTHLLKES